MQQDERPPRMIASAKTVAAVERLAKADRRTRRDRRPMGRRPVAAEHAGRRGRPSHRRRAAAPARRLHDQDHGRRRRAATVRSFLGFLDRITGGDAELVAYLQRVFGYALDRRHHASTRCSFGYGTGANGKSVLLSTIAGILGDYHETAQIETFTVSNADRHPTELAALRGARLVTATETEEGRRWAESRRSSN